VGFLFSETPESYKERTPEGGGFERRPEVRNRRRPRRRYGSSERLARSTAEGRGNDLRAGLLGRAGEPRPDASNPPARRRSDTDDSVDRGSEAPRETGV